MYMHYIARAGVSVNEVGLLGVNLKVDTRDLSKQELTGKDEKIKRHPPKKRQSPLTGLCLGGRVGLMVNFSTGSLWVSSDGLPFILCFLPLS
jgi:hypothetical protein